MKYAVRTLILTLLALLVAVPASAGRLDMKPCEIPGAERAKCGSLSVPENPAEVGGRHIDLRVVVLEPTGDSAQGDPIFYLSGGPGTAASDMAPAFSSSPLRSDRAIVFVDQRGTGGSTPLRCDLGDFAEALPMLLDFDLSSIAAECAAELSKTADLRFYSTRYIVDDLDAVRRGLGYPQINLIAGSYGTRVALEYLRQHEAHARTAVLRGVAGPETRVPLGFARSSLAALQGLGADCTADSACSKDFPDLEASVRRLRAQLDVKPVDVEVPDPTTGKPFKLKMSGDEFAALLHYPLYGTEFAARIPAMVKAAERGDFSPSVQIAAALGAQLLPRFYFGSFLAILCSEDVPFIAAEDLAAASHDTLLEGVFVEGILASCSVWPRLQVSEDDKRPVESDVPVLLVSGQVDPVTPASDAESAGQGLAHSLHLVLPGIGHFGMFPGCSARLVEDFVQRGSVEGLDGSCVAEIERPAFPS